MITDPTEQSVSAQLAEGWKQLVKAFDYEFETLPEEFLYETKPALKLANNELLEIIAWARNTNLIEPADEPGRLRLTPIGRASWRNTRDSS
ncbi:MAG TPA: hypothetical protein VIP51_11535 [Eoetvoesiella sp.]